MMRIGHGFDAHRLAEGRPFIVGGVRIEHDRGPLGHSDGDPLAHAICDALLGACALGELGALFPSSDERFSNMDSMMFLERCIALVREAGYEPVNIDATVVVQRPRIGPHAAAIRERLAAVMALRVADVSVKAKTSDGLGYTGDGTGVAAYAVALVRRA
jgi:2-C-methyl-D-erythritol 2,4-cyclodiphosphate synthase